jgi:hypothetical protein
MLSHNLEMRTRLMNGRVLLFTLREVQELFQSRALLGFSVAMWLSIIIIDPYFFSTIPSFSSRAFYWGTMMVIYMIIFPKYVITIGQIWAKFTARPIPHPLLSLPLIFVLSWLSTLLPFILGDWVPQRYGGFSLALFMRNWLITLALENIGIYFFWPKPSEKRAGNAEEDVVVKRNVTIGDVTIATVNIKLATSDGHFLKIHTVSGEKEYRARMKDFLAQLSSSEGISSHRSHWVAIGQISEVRKNMIVTVSGTQIPIARGRRDSVQLWAKEYL